MRLNTKPMFIEIDDKKIIIGMVDLEEWFIRDCITKQKLPTYNVVIKNIKMMRKKGDEVNLE